MDMLHSAESMRQCECFLSRHDATTVLANIEINQHIYVQLGLTHRFVQCPRTNEAIDNDFDAWILLHQRHQPCQFWCAYNFSGDQKIFNSTLSHDLRLAHLRNTSTNGTRCY